MKVNIPSDFVPQIVVQPTYYSGQNSVSLFKPTYDGNDTHALEKNFFERADKNIISVDLDEGRFEIGLKI